MRKFTLMMLLGTLMATGCTDTALTTNNEAPHLGKVDSRSMKALAFDFPTIQWETFETYDQKLAACEIPDSILPKIPTENLVEICMKYPLLLDAYAFNTPLQGIKTVASRFNGFKELMKREDNCLHLFNYLKTNNLRNRNFTLMTQVEIGRTTLVYGLAEYVLSFENVLCNATESMKDEITSFVDETLENKENNTNYHALGSLTSSVYLWASIISDNSKSRSLNPTIDSFLKTGMIRNADEYLFIKQQCQTFN